MLLLVSGLAAYVVAIDYLNLRQLPTPNPQDGFGRVAVTQPWGGFAWRVLARGAGELWQYHPAQSDAILTAAASRYPLETRQWLDRARIVLHVPEIATELDAHLLAAMASQPNDREGRWRAIQIAIQAGQLEAAEYHLRRWLDGRPSDTDQALLIARRWLHDSEALIDRILPTGEEYLSNAMRLARQQQDILLAEALWSRLEQPRPLDDRLFLDYVEFLMDRGQLSRASRLWSEADPTYEPGDFPNGRFERELGEDLGLNWRTGRLPAGVDVRIDPAQGRNGDRSLRVDFRGDENIRLSAPWIRLPVYPGQTYRLSGHWRADRLTTRSLPFIHLTAEGQGLSEVIELPSASFDWQAWEVEFQVPDDVRVIRLRLRRNPTQAFDRNIAGSLWLDDFQLRPAPVMPELLNPTEPGDADE